MQHVDAMMLLRRACLIALVICQIAGCSGGTNAIVDTVAEALRPAGDGEPPKLDPAYEYIRVKASGRVAYLAKDPAPSRVEVFYSGDREILRLQQGRVLGLVGATTEWRRGVLPEFPSWRSLARAGEHRWTRVRDVMPGYQFDTEDELVLRVIEPPAGRQLERVETAQLTWFEEQVVRSVDPLPPAFYAVDVQNELVVYAEQCLTTYFCLSWQRWPAQGHSSRQSR